MLKSVSRFIKLFIKDKEKNLKSSQKKKKKTLSTNSKKKFLANFATENMKTRIE